MLYKKHLFMCSSKYYALNDMSTMLFFNFIILLHSIKNITLVVYILAFNTVIPAAFSNVSLKC